MYNCYTWLRWKSLVQARSAYPIILTLNQTYIPYSHCVFHIVFPCLRFDDWSFTPPCSASFFSRESDWKITSSLSRRINPNICKMVELNWKMRINFHFALAVCPNSVIIWATFGWTAQLDFLSDLIPSKKPCWFHPYQYFALPVSYPFPGTPVVWTSAHKLKT